MKNIVKTTSLYLLCILTVVPIFLSFFRFDIFIVISAAYAVFMLIIFIYPDKFMLKMLNAREIVEVDKDKIYQFIKHQSFKNSVKVPQIYSYRGNIPKIFLLKGKGGHTLAIEETLFDNLNQDEIASFVNYLLIQDRKGLSYLRAVTNILALIISKIAIIARDIVLFLSKNKNLSQSVFLVLIFFLNPLFYILFWFSKSEILNKEALSKDSQLQSVYNKLFSLKITESFLDHFLVLNKISETNSKMIAIQILELFPSSYVRLKEIYD